MGNDDRPAFSGRHQDEPIDPGAGVAEAEEGRVGGVPFEEQRDSVRAEPDHAEARKSRLGRRPLAREVAQDEAGDEPALGVRALLRHEQALALGVECQHPGRLLERLREAHVEAIEQGRELPLESTVVVGSSGRQLAGLGPGELGPARGPDRGAEPRDGTQVQLALFRPDVLLDDPNFGSSGRRLGATGLDELARPERST